MIAPRTAFLTVLSCWPEWKRTGIAIVLLSMAGAACSFLAIRLTGGAYDTILETRTAPMQTIMLLMTLWLSTFVLSFWRTRENRAFGSSLARSVRLSLFRKALDLGPAYVERLGHEHLALCLISDTASISNVFGPAVVGAVTAFLFIVAAVAGLFTISPVLAVVTAAGVFLLSLPLFFFARSPRFNPREVQEARDALRTFLIERMAGSWTICMFDQIGGERLELAKLEEKLHGAERRSNLGLERLLLAQVAVGVVAATLALFWIATDPQGPRLAAGAVAMVVSFALQFAMNLLPILRGGRSIQEMKGVFERIAAILQIEAVQPDADSPKPEGGTLALENLSFGYPGRPGVLRSIDLCIEPSQWTLVMGANGAGKSTLARLLAGIYEPSQGTVLFGGTRLGARPLGTGVVLVQAHEHFFATSCAANVAFANPGLSVDETEDLLTGVDLVDLYRPAPQALSVGQRQRLAIARALANKPHLLILDDAISNLDPEGEATVLSFVRRQLPNATVVIFSTREIAVPWFDRNFWLMSGKLVSESPTRQS